MKQNENVYFLHKTDDQSIEKDVFENGLLSWYGYSMHSTMWRIPNDNLTLEELDAQIKNYADNENTTVYCIKIPKKYLCHNIHSTSNSTSGRFDFPIPFWKDEVVGGSQVARFTPHLIMGSYNPKTGYKTNKNYSQTFDATGLKYANEQIDIVRASAADEIDMRLLDFMTRRSKKSFSELKSFDNSNGIICSKMEKYKNEFEAQK